MLSKFRVPRLMLSLPRFYQRAFGTKRPEPPSLTLKTILSWSGDSPKPPSSNSFRCERLGFRSMSKSLGVRAKNEMLKGE